MKNGVSLEKLRSREIGHNLEACLNLSEQKGLDIFNKEEKAITGVLSQYYLSTEFGYIETGVKHWPEFREVEAIAEKLLMELAARPDFNNEKLIWERRAKALQ